MVSAMDLNKFVKLKWYVQGFNGTPQFISVGYISGFEGMWNRLGYGYTRMINSFKNDYCEYFYSVDDLNNLGRIIFQKLKEDTNYLVKLSQEEGKDRKSQFKFLQKSWKITLSQLSDSELFELYQETYYWYSLPPSISHIQEAFIFVDEKIKEQLNLFYEKSSQKKKFNDYFTILSQPIRPSFVNEEHYSLIKILKYILKNGLKEQLLSSKIIDKTLLKLLASHQQEFFWVRSNYAHGNALEVADFLKELQQLLEKNVNVEAELSTERTLYQKNILEKKKALAELGITSKDKAGKELLQLLDASELVLHWQDDRKKMILMSIPMINSLLVELAKRYNLSHRLLLYLLPKEVNSEFFESLSNEKLQERKKGCTFFFELTEKDNSSLKKDNISNKYYWNKQEISGNISYGMNTRMVTGKEYVEYAAKLSPKEKEKVTDLHGTCASTGTAIGKVRICKTKDDIEHFPEGFILVSSMTRPEFVPAMKKAKAIVTDEGGITCHAAIVSRELNKPCVIGTKIATKVLQDGMMVEVKASHGLVRILGE